VLGSDFNYFIQIYLVCMKRKKVFGIPIGRS